MNKARNRTASTVTGKSRRLSLGLMAAVIAASYGSASALGLGEAESTAGLGQPLSMVIPLRASAPEARLLEARLISMTMPGEHITDQNQLARGYRISVEIDGHGQPQIVLKSRSRVTEPYLEFTLELVSGNTRVRREFTVLVDPPGYQMPAPATRAGVMVAAATPASTSRAAPVAMAAATPAATMSPVPKGGAIAALPARIGNPDADRVARPVAVSAALPAMPEVAGGPVASVAAERAPAQATPATLAARAPAPAAPAALSVRGEPANSHSTTTAAPPSDVDAPRPSRPPRVARPRQIHVNAPAASPAQALVHVVRNGECLGSIAQHYARVVGLPVAEVAERLHKTNPHAFGASRDVMYAGSQLALNALAPVAEGTLALAPASEQTSPSRTTRPQLRLAEGIQATATPTPRAQAATVMPSALPAELRMNPAAPTHAPTPEPPPEWLAPIGSAQAAPPMQPSWQAPRTSYGAVILAAVLSSALTSVAMLAAFMALGGRRLPPG